MPKYKYIGRNGTGDIIKGIYEAEDKSSVAIMLKKRGYYATSILEYGKTRDVSEFLNSLIYRVKLQDLSVYCRQFSVIINAGIPIMSALEILQKQTKNSVLVRATENVRADLNRGLTLGEAFKNNSNVFPDIFVNMVKAGEISGSLNQVLDRLAAHFEREKELANKAKSAMTYPTILSVVATTVVVFLVTQVLPVYASLFEGYGATLPLPTRILLFISQIIAEKWMYILGILMVLILLFSKFKSTKKGKIIIENFIMKIPVLGETTRKITISRFARVLSTMMASGIPLLEAIQLVNRVIDNEMLRLAGNKIRENVQGGSGIYEAVKIGEFFPPLVVEMVAVGEETGKLDEMLNKLADYYDEEIKHTLDRLTTILEPVIVVIMAVVIGFIIVSIVLPMFEMLKLVG